MIWMAWLVAGAHELPSNWSSDVIFVKGGVDIVPAAEANLTDFAEMLVVEPDLVVEIRVHSDSQGATDANLAFTQERADALRAWMVERGVSAEQLKSAGVGEAEPVAENSTASGRARNRRVEFKLLEDSDHSRPYPSELTADRVVDLFNEAREAYQAQQQAAAGPAVEPSPALCQATTPPELRIASCDLVLADDRKNGQALYFAGLGHLELAESGRRGHFTSAVDLLKSAVKRSDGALELAADEALVRARLGARMER